MSLYIFYEKPEDIYSVSCAQYHDFYILEPGRNASYNTHLFTYIQKFHVCTCIWHIARIRRHGNLKNFRRSRYVHDNVPDHDNFKDGP